MGKVTPPGTGESWEEGGGGGDGYIPDPFCFDSHSPAAVRQAAAVADVYVSDWTIEKNN